MAQDEQVKMKSIVQRTVPEGNAEHLSMTANDQMVNKHVIENTPSNPVIQARGRSSPNDLPFDDDI